ncbi:MAG: DUF4856 domain-containing protein [Nonlabens sp.]|uniref:DUF4856 domain-containing protein n=2 Tax=Nonlabens sp. TaxID=1888209 RepID=UPI0035A70422
MKFTKISFLVLTAVFAATFTSCDNDDEASITNNVIAPATYSFERNSESSVAYSGQTTRIKMADELAAALKDDSLNEVSIDAMFAHVEGANNFSDASLNASDKSARSKVAASTDFFAANSTDATAIKSEFDGFIAAQANDVFPFWNNTATAGVAGQLQEAGGGSVRYMCPTGVDYDHAFVNGLIGTLMVDQMLNNYLSTAVLDAGDYRVDNDNDLVATGKPYTDMEHKWDEAFGYLYGAEVDATSPVLNVDQYLNKYLNRVESSPNFNGIAATIYDAFKLGRAAIVAKNYDVRDQQADIIKEEVSNIIGIRAVYYLQVAQNFLAADKATAFHDLSEGYGFIYSLQFTRKAGTDQPYFSKSEVDAYLSELMTGNGFWDVTPATLNRISDEISARFEFTTEQAGS